MSGALSEGGSLLGVLQTAGLGRDSLFELLNVAGKVIDFRHCKAGDRYRLVVSVSGEPLRLEYFGSGNQVLGAERKGGKLVPLRERLRGERDLRVLRGTITSSLEPAMVATGGTPRLAANLADLFAWDLDFNVDPRQGDTFAVAIERVRLPDGTWREEAIAAAEYRGESGHFTAFRFQTPYGEEFFDAEGRPLKRRYLASPLPFVRITSKFGHRWHPILARPAHHGGIDYGGPTGTPAWAVADGVVEFAARKGAYGKLVVIRHPDGMRSYYGHLSQIEAGTQKGSRIRQKQVLGRVGATGRATGPHLHFAMRGTGRFIDPAKFRGKRGAPLAGKIGRDFRHLVADLGTRLGGVRLAAAPR
jgi:murein DD-endopeptidase MepM/ murein hydrolase activator NlpD